MAGLPGIRPPDRFILDGDTYHVTGWAGAVDILPGFDAAAWPLAVLCAVLDQASTARLLTRCIDEADPLDLPDLHRVAAQLVEATFGRSYWVVGRLLAMAADSWHEVDGVLLLRGVDLAVLLDTAPARAVNVLWALAVEGRDESARSRLDFELNQPPVSAPPGTPLWGAEDEAAGFLAAMAAT